MPDRGRGAAGGHHQLQLSGTGVQRSWSSSTFTAPVRLRPRDREDGTLPLGEREAVRDDRCQVEAVAHEVEVVLERVLAYATDVLDAERVRADDVELLEVQGRPLEALRCLDAADDERASRL